MKKVLIAGGAGFIGSALVPRLIELGYEVKVIDLLWFGNYLPIEVIQKDLFGCTEEDIKGFDEFIFLAGLSNDPMAEYSPAQNFISNGALPTYLAYLCKRAGVKRFIYASSASVYGFTDRLVSEYDKPVSNYPYGISKLHGEQGVLQLQDENFSVVVLRQGTVCGYSPRVRMDLIVNTMFKSALEGKITVNNPNIWRPVYDIRDCVESYVKVLESNAHGIFNIAGGNFTVLAIAYIVQKTLEDLGLEVKVEINKVPDKRNYKISCDKAEKVLKFEPQYKIADIVMDLWNHRDQMGDLNQDKYYNIRVFKNL